MLETNFILITFKFICLNRILNFLLHVTYLYNQLNSNHNVRKFLFSSLAHISSNINLLKKHKSIFKAFNVQLLNRLLHTFIIGHLYGSGARYYTSSNPNACKYSAHQIKHIVDYNHLMV